MSLVWLGLLLVTALVLLAANRRHRRRHRTRRTRMEAFTPIDPGANATYMLPQVPKPPPPMSLDQNRSPLTPYLTRALDRDAPAEGGQTQDSPWTYDEVRGLASRVVARVNARNPGFDLALVSFDGVSKTVDAGKTLRYQFDAQVHSARQRLSGRVTVKVVATPDDKEFIRDIAVHGAKADFSTIQGSAGLAGHVEYAAYQPVATYVPQPV